MSKKERYTLTISNYNGKGLPKGDPFYWDKHLKAYKWNAIKRNISMVFDFIMCFICFYIAIKYSSK